MSLPGKWKTYIHSLVGIAVAMAVIGLTLHFLNSRGPTFVQGPAKQVGNLVFGQTWGF